MNRLSQLLDSQLSKRGWRRSKLATISGVSEPTISRIMNDATYIPELKTMTALSQALGLPLRRVIEACGFPLDSADLVHAAVQNEDAHRVQHLLTAVPEYQAFLAILAKLSRADRLAVMTFAEMLVHTRSSN